MMGRDLIHIRDQHHASLVALIRALAENVELHPGNCDELAALTDRLRPIVQWWTDHVEAHR